MLKIHYSVLIAFCIFLLAFVSTSQETIARAKVAKQSLEEELMIVSKESLIDTLLGTWKITSYKSPELSKFLTRKDPNGDLGFYMESDVYATSYLILLRDGTYRIMSTGGYGHMDGTIDEGAWTITEDLQTITLTREYEENWVLRIVERTPQKMILTFMHGAYENGGSKRFTVTVTLERMGRQRQKH